MNIGRYKILWWPMIWQDRETNRLRVDISWVWNKGSWPEKEMITDSCELVYHYWNIGFFEIRRFKQSVKKS